MIIGTIIVGIFIFALITLGLYISKRCDDNFDVDVFGAGVFIGMIIAVLIVFETALVAVIIYGPRPSALDVYQGKTTIEYSIRDGVKVDSVVVFKDNYDEK